MKQKIIVAFEGLPGSGKTTIAQMLAQAFNGDYIPEIISNKKYLSNQDEYYIESEKLKVKKYKKSLKKYIFLDRSPLSMLAYNFGKKANGLENIYKGLQVEFNKIPQPDLYVYLKINDVNICNQRKGTKDRNPIWTDINNLKEIRNFYEKYFSKTKKSIIISAEDNSINKIYNLITIYLKQNYEK